MTGSKEDLIRYKLQRARDTFEDAKILSERNRWNSTINRLYYSAYYAITALLLDSDLKPVTHNGVKSSFSEHFVKTDKIPKELGKIILNFLHGGKKATTMTCLILTKERLCHILTLLKNSLS